MEIISKYRWRRRRRRRKTCHQFKVIRLEVLLFYIDSLSYFLSKPTRKSCARCVTLSNSAFIYLSHVERTQRRKKKRTRKTTTTTVFFFRCTIKWRQSTSAEHRIFGFFFSNKSSLSMSSSPPLLRSCSILSDHHHSLHNINDYSYDKLTMKQISFFLVCVLENDS